MHYIKTQIKTALNTKLTKKIIPINLYYAIPTNLKKTSKKTTVELKLSHCQSIKELLGKIEAANENTPTKSKNLKDGKDTGGSNGRGNNDRPDDNGDFPEKKRGLVITYLCGAKEIYCPAKKIKENGKIVHIEFFNRIIELNNVLEAQSL